MKHKIIISLLGVTLFGCASDFYYENGKKIEVTKIDDKSIQKKVNANDAIQYYKNSKGHKIGVKNDILIKCKEKVACKELLSKYETTSIRSLSPTIFIVEIAKEKNVFEFSQKLYEDENISIAHPNFRKEKKRR